jgi:hypothetical protein
VLGLLGNSGNTDGPHLHFGIQTRPDSLSARPLRDRRLRRRGERRTAAGPGRRGAQRQAARGTAGAAAHRHRHEAHARPPVSVGARHTHPSRSWLDTCLLRLGFLRRAWRKGFMLGVHAAEVSGVRDVGRVVLVYSLVAGVCAVVPVAGRAAPGVSPGQGSAVPGTFEPVACSEVRVNLGGRRVTGVDSVRGLKAAPMTRRQRATASTPRTAQETHPSSPGWACSACPRRPRATR